MILTLATSALPRDYPSSRVAAAIEGHGEADATREGLLFSVHALRVAGEYESDATEYVWAAVWANSSRMADYLWSPEGLPALEATLGLLKVSVLPIATAHLNRVGLRAATAFGVSTALAASGDAATERVAQLRAEARRAIEGKDRSAAVRALDPATSVETSIDVIAAPPRRYEGRLFTVLSAQAPDRD